MSETNEMSMDTRLVRSPELVFTDMDGELVAMSISRGSYYGIGGVGPTVWTLLEAPVSIQEIVQSICRDFDVDEATCRTDMLAFAQDLVRNGVAHTC